MAKLTLKAPPPKSALAAMARAAGLPKPDAPVPKPQAAKPKPDNPPAGKAKRKQDPAAAAKWKATKGAYIAFKAARAATARRADERAADLALCRERFPGLFDADHPRPLAIGVRKDLAEVLGLKRTKRLLLWWTAWPAYVAAIAAGGPRYQLDGTIAGAITEAQRAAAQAALASNQAAQPRQEAA